MKHFKTVLKILIILSYFLPFVSCSEFMGEKPEKEILSTTASDSIVMVYSADTLSKPDISRMKTDSAEALKITSDKNTNADLLGNIYSLTIFPTSKSISGFGVCVLHEDVSCILIAVSILLSISLLFEKQIRFIKRNLVFLYATSLSCLVLFVLYCMCISDVDLEWGIGLTILLTFISLWLAVGGKRATTANL